MVSPQIAQISADDFNLVTIKTPRHKELKMSMVLLVSLCLGGSLVCLLFAEAIALAQQPAGTAQKFADSPFGYHGAYAQRKYDLFSPEQRAILNKGLGITDIVGYSRYTVGCLADIGVRWERPAPYADWFLVQPTQEDVDRGVFHWEYLDRVYGYEHGAGINTIANLSMRSGIEYSQNMPPRHAPGSWMPADPEKYSQYVRAVVERYDGDGVDDAPNGLVIKHWQLENEINVKDPNQKKFDSPASYADWLLLTYRVAKEADPDCKILIAGPPNPPVFEETYIPILERLKGKGFDIFDIHYYGDAKRDYHHQLDSYLARLRSELSRNGFDNPRFWITETCTNSGSFRTKSGIAPAQTEREQALSLVKRNLYPLFLGIEKVFWCFGLVEGFGKPDDDYFDHAGLIYEGIGDDDRGAGVKKLAYYTYKKMTEMLEGSDWAHIKAIDTKTPNVRALSFPRKGADTGVTVVWWDYFDESEYKPGMQKEIKLPCSARNAKVIEALPMFEYGDQVSDYATAFRIRTIESEAGFIAVTMGDAPVYIIPE